MGKLGIWRSFLYTLSRIPGLGFLRGTASTISQVDRTQSNINAKKNMIDRDVDSAKRAGDTFKDKKN